MNSISKKYKISFLINPVSGGGQGKDVYEFLPEIMVSMGFDDDHWKAEYTLQVGAEEQIYRFLADSERLIAVGGDGTISAVLNAIATCGDNLVELGLVPLGTGNDLARTLRLYEAYVNRGLMFLVRSLIRAQTIPFDLWMVNDKLAMAAYISAGYDAKITESFNSDRAHGCFKSTSALKNKQHYGYCAWKHMNYQLGKNSNIEILNPRGIWENYDIGGYCSVVIGNIPSFASGLDIFQKTDISDGLLEVVFFPHRAAFFGTLVSTAISKNLGKIFKNIYTPSHHAREIKLHLRQKEAVQLDGEGMCSAYKCDIIHIKRKTQVKLMTLPRHSYMV